jgi:hypothetical protein
MKNNLNSFWFSALILIVTNLLTSGDVSAEEQTRTLYPTNWKVVNTSFTELLNDGWNIIGRSSTHVVTTTPSGAIGREDNKYVYTLSKRGKFITCFLENPKTDVRIGATSGCRLLN